MLNYTIYVSFSIGWPLPKFSIFDWKEIDIFWHFYQRKFSRNHKLHTGAPYINGNSYQNNIQIKIFLLSFSLTIYNIISIQLQKKCICQIKVDIEIFLKLTPTLMNIQWWSCLKERATPGPNSQTGIFQLLWSSWLQIRRETCIWEDLE